jgi:cysteine desulfurase
MGYMVTQRLARIFTAGKPKDAVETARKSIAGIFNVTPKEIIFTSGATESNNLAIVGAAQANQNFGKHIITSLTEHKAVLDTCQFLENKGFEITYIKPDNNGLIDINKLKQEIKIDTILVSIMHVNNETGVIQDIAAIGNLLKSSVAQSHVLFHVDAAQSVGRLSLDLNKLNVDLLSVSGHKIYGPKGIGALYISKANKSSQGQKIEPQMHGGRHEYGYRSGTLATHQIVGLAYALQLCIECLEQESSRLSELENILLTGLQKLGGVFLNGAKSERKPGHINISIEGVHGEALIAALSSNIAVSSGSACNSAVSATSHVLKAMGICDELAQSAIRISLGRFTSADDVRLALECMTQVINKLRDSNPRLHANQLLS